MKAYFIFFSYNRALPRPIAVFFDKNKAYKHIHQFGEEHIELRMCDWKEGVLPRWVDTTLVEVPPKKDKSRNMTSEEKKLTHEFVLSKFEKDENKEANSNLEKQKR